MMTESIHRVLEDLENAFKLGLYVKRHSINTGETKYLPAISDPLVARAFLGLKQELLKQKRQN